MDKLFRLGTAETGGVHLSVQRGSPHLNLHTGMATIP